MPYFPKKEHQIKNEGYLGHFKLWDFWEEIPIEFQKKILHYYENKPLMWDYKSLFEGKFEGSSMGIIQTLGLLLCIDDLEFLDLIFKKFESIEIENYNNIVILGLNYEYGNQTRKASEIYWKDVHFFLLEYSKTVYKHFLHKNCDEKRFKYAFELEFKNLNKIIEALKKEVSFPIFNPILEQYLIFLEKRNEF